MHVDAPRSNNTRGSPQSHSNIVPSLAIDFWHAIVSHRIASEITSASLLSTFHAPDKRKRLYYSHLVHMPVRLPRSAGIQRYIHRHGIGKHTVHSMIASVKQAPPRFTKDKHQHPRPTKRSHFHRPTSAPTRARRASS